MRSPRAPVIAVCTLAVLLTGCSASSSVDEDAAGAWYAAVSDDPSVNGAATLGMHVGPGSAGEVRADFDEPVGIVGADARCYGGDGVTADVTVNVTTDDGGQITVTVPVPCDTEPHRIPFDDASARAVSASGTAPVATYLYVTAIAAS